MKKMTVTELNTLVDYVAEKVLDQKRNSVLAEKSNISEDELNETFAKAQALCKAMKEAKKAYENAKEDLKEYESKISGQNHLGRFVALSSYYGECSIQTLSNDCIFRDTPLEPYRLKKDIQTKLVLKNLGSEVDVEKFIEELVKSY